MSFINPTSSYGLPAYQHRAYQCIDGAQSAFFPSLVLSTYLLTKLRQPVDSIYHQVKAVNVIEYRHIKGGGDGAFFLIAPDMHVLIIAFIHQAMDQPRIAVKGEDNVFVTSENRIIIGVAQAVRGFQYRAPAW